MDKTDVLLYPMKYEHTSRSELNLCGQRNNCNNILVHFDNSNIFQVKYSPKENSSTKGTNCQVH